MSPGIHKLALNHAIRMLAARARFASIEDGKHLTMLKRYLSTDYNMTPDEYRARWGLPSDYPMVAPNYSARRSELAKQIGLGSKGGRGKR